MPRGRWFIAAVIGVAMASASCTTSSDGTTTTTESGPVTTLATSTTSTTSPTSTTLAPITQLSAPEYQIVERIPLETGGDEVIALLDPSTYDSLTDVDLFDIVAEIVDRFPPVTTLHIVDDPSAADVVANPDASEAERAAIAANYLARLENGFRIVYLGPFADSGSAVLGS